MISAGRDQAYIMMHNAKQIFEIVSAASGDSLLMGSYDTMDCSKLPSDADKLACEWHILAGQSHLQQIADNDDWNQQVLQVGFDDIPELGWTYANEHKQKTLVAARSSTFDEQYGK